MSRDQKLEDLREKEQRLFSQKQAAYVALRTARTNADEAYQCLVSARSVLDQKRSAMNMAYDAVNAARNESERIWGEYRRIKAANSPAIDAAKRTADAEHQEMVRCFTSASHEYEYGDRSLAPALSSEGRDHRDRRNALNEDVKRLAQEIKDARTYTEAHAPRVDWAPYNSLKTEFNTAKAERDRREREFKDLKAERERLKAEFDRLKAAHQAAKDAANARKAELKAENTRAREQALSKTGVPLFERGDAKVVEKPDGTTHVYHGGIGEGDGAGHGHTVLDRSGNVTYDRAAFAEHGGQNFKDDSPEDPALKTYPTRGHWDGLRHGWVDGQHPVTWTEGTGPNAGQTLIRDGFVDFDGFDRKSRDERNHDHYGPDARYSNGSERIEDEGKGGYRGYYTGPGH